LNNKAKTLHLLKAGNSILMNTYFGKLFLKDKFVFCLVFLFFLFSVVANMIKLETTPFFLWNLYAERYYPEKDYTIHEIRYNNKILNFRNSWRQPEQILLMDPLLSYISVRHDHQPDYWHSYLEDHWTVKHPRFKSWIPKLSNQQAQYDAFPGWYVKYLSSIVNEPIVGLTVLRKKLHYERDGRIVAIASDTVLLIR
jgi:hypothetical protein